MTFEQAGAILATIAMSVHKTPPPPDVISLRDYMDGSLRHYGGMLPKHIANMTSALPAPEQADKVLRSPWRLETG